MAKLNYLSEDDNDSQTTGKKWQRRGVCPGGLTRKQYRRRQASQGNNSTKATHVGIY